MGLLTAITAIGVFLSKVQVFIVLASMAYQIVQAKKMRNAAKAAAEARKGFELVVEAAIQPIPLVYGRAIIGGTRVYHNTSSSFVMPTTPTTANKTFSTGAAAQAGDNYTYTDENGSLATVTYGGTPEKKLNSNINGSKNEFLFFQQALCVGPINAVYDVIIDETQFLNDPALGDSYTEFVYKSGSFVRDTDNKAAMRLDYFYNGGVDPIMSSNFGERSTATFNNIAYLSATIRLDRDEPQFNKVPTIQTFIEGRVVREISRSGTSPNFSYALGNNVYSNNPAYCLLDYLLDSTVGKGLTISDIDLGSFYDAAQICNTVVQSNVNVGGNIWQTTDKITRNISTRNLPLYECNIIIDVSKPIRENVQSILSTMGDARLVWSQGRYKLLLQYPATNANINLAATITDDDLVHDKPVEILWPSASDRLNSCTIRYHNEATNFKEDSVSWPPKINSTFARGLGATKYVAVSGWEGTSEGERLLNNYAVWNGGSNTTSMSWKIVAPSSGDYALKFTADDVIDITLNTTSSRSGHTGVSTVTRTLTANAEYTISISATNTGGLFGAAATLTAPDGTTVWTTRSDAYTSFVNISQTNTVYNAYLAEDNNVKLETDIFAEGITDYYHAIAKAEETVRISRTARTIRFQYVLKNNYLEPGDIIKLNSATLSLGNTSDVYLRVNEVKLEDNAICEVVGSQFDAAQLVWSTKDSQAINAIKLYNFFLYAPSSLTFTAGNNVVANSPGTLTWPASSSPSISGYILYFHKVLDLDSSGRPIYNEIGRATQTLFYVPDLGDVNGVFGVRAFTDSIVSDLRTSGNAVRLNTALVPPTPTGFAVALGGDYNQVSKLTWTIPALRSNGIPYADHFFTKIFRAKDIPNPVFIEVGTSGTSEYLDISAEFGNLLYRIAFVSRRNITGNLSSIVSTTLQPNYSVIPGISAPSVNVSNENISFGAPLNGYAGIVFSSGSSEITAFIGNTQLTYGTTGANTFSVTSQASTGITVAAGTGTGSTYTVPAPTAMSADVAFTDLSIVVRDGAGTALPAISKRITYSLSRRGEGGAEGTKSVAISCFKWSTTPISPIPSQAATLTWADLSINSYPSGWTAVPGAAANNGMVLYQLTAIVTATVSATTTNFNWSSGYIGSIGYRQDGSIGLQGKSSRTAYTVTTSATPPTGITAGTGDVVPTSPGTWSFSATSTLTEGQYMYQVDGLYDVVTDAIVWGNAYLSNLKVGSLSAISANLGAISAGSININSGVATISNTGAAVFRNIQIQDSGGGIILQSNGNIDYSRVNNKPASLNDINTAESTKLTGIATGANNTSIDANGLIQGVSSGSGTLVSNDKIRSGGINLVGNSGFMKTSPTMPTNWSLYNNAGVATTTSVQAGGLFGQNYYRVTTGANTTSTMGIYIVPSSTDSVKAWEPGQTYCISYWARGQAGAVGKTMNGFDSNMGFNTTTILENPAVTGTWQRYVFKGKPNSNATTPNGELFLSWFTTGTLNSGSIIDICCPKVELGDQPSSWTPAPQDLVSVGNKITATTASTFIADAAIQNAQIGDAQISLAKINTATIGSLSAITATIGTLRTTASGSRVEIRDNVIEVYESNVLRVKIGNL